MPNLVSPMTSGSYFFPVTPFGPEGQLILPCLIEHVRNHLRFPVSAVFAACGTGEFHSLSADEVGYVVAAVQKVVSDKIMLFGPAGGPLGHALECARQTRDAGADGLLIMAPAFTPETADSHTRYLEAVLTETELPALVYSRLPAPLATDTVRSLLKHPQFLGYKDGMGNLKTLQEATALGEERTGRPFIVINGLPLAEISAHKYNAIGVSRYTSSAFTMDPEIATAYAQALQTADTDLTKTLMTSFYKPLEALRRRCPGQGISLVKAAVRLNGCDVGSVRPPLQDLSAADVADLLHILRVGREVIR